MPWRLRQAQEIERQLKECETRTRELERRGAVVEQSLRGEPGGEGGDESELMSEWFELVHEKTGLSRWEQELSIRARQLELEDRDARLQHQLSLPGCSAGVAEELRSVREQREHLMVMLEQDRLRYVEEDRDIETVMIRKGLQLPSVRRETGV
ncbi:protein of unknown function DUF3585 [Trinorchestia longiramus]|nr:protein of unknown function DUF3585 [Trinorchestia longiramus]